MVLILIVLLVGAVWALDWQQDKYLNIIDEQNKEVATLNEAVSLMFVQIKHDNNLITELHKTISKGQKELNYTTEQLISANTTLKVIQADLVTERDKSKELTLEINDLEANLIKINEFAARLRLSLDAYKLSTKDLKTQLEELKDLEFIPWKSTDEVRAWLKVNPISENEYVSETYDCENFAIDLFWAAIKDRRIIGLMWVDNANTTRDHVMCFVSIGNEIYSLEPQNDRLSPFGQFD